MNNLPQITDVLSLLDHMRNDEVAAAPQFGPQAIDEARQNLEQAVFEVLAPSSAQHEKIWDAPSESIEQGAKVEGALEGIRSPRAKGPFSDRLSQFIYSVPKPVTIISTNYDIEVDSILFRDRAYAQIWAQIDLGFDARDPYSGGVLGRPSRPEFALFKLHGSLNWLRCSLCGHVYMNPLGSIAYLAFLERSTPATTCHCGFPSLRHLLVAPSFVRDIREPNILTVWRSALEALRTTSRWYFLGYSLPPEDIAIRSIILRAYHARKPGNRPEAVIVQGSGNTKQRFEMMFGNMQFHSDGIEAFLGTAA
ncbi:MAG TPA: hypothetical protein VGL97_25005 [Bryobacteraceae bacterium]